MRNKPLDVGIGSGCGSYDMTCSSFKSQLALIWRYNKITTYNVKLVIIYKKFQRKIHTILKFDLPINSTWVLWLFLYLQQYRFHFIFKFSNYDSDMNDFFYFFNEETWMNDCTSCIFKIITITPHKRWLKLFL